MTENGTFLRTKSASFGGWILFLLETLLTGCLSHVTCLEWDQKAPLLTFDIPQTALVATLDTYDLFNIISSVFQSMQIMGNSRARAVYEAEVPEGFRRPQTDSHLDSFIRTKYEKKKYIAREWVPTKVPDLPDGWTALIEAEKQKKDIRSIVLPSHSSINDNNGHNNENLANNVSTKRF
jgi:hypothetical protein